MGNNFPSPIAVGSSPQWISQPNHGEVRNCEREWRWVIFTPVDRGHYQFGRDQAIQMYGSFEWFPLWYCGVWVGNIMIPGWSPLEMYTIFTILVLSGHLPLEKFLKFSTLTISVTAKKNMFGWFMSDMILPILCFSKHFTRFFSDPQGTFGRCSLCASLHRVAIHGTKMSWDLWTRNLSASWQLLLIHLLSNDEHPWWIFWQFLGAWATTCLFFTAFLFFFSVCFSN